MANGKIPQTTPTHFFPNFNTVSLRLGKPDCVGVGLGLSNELTNERTNERKKDRTKEVNERTNERANERTNEGTNERMNEWTNCVTVNVVLCDLDPNFQSQKSETLISQKWLEPAQNAWYDVYRLLYLQSNGTMANVVPRDLDIYFHYQTLSC